jgi:hypothetical protein
VREKHCWRGASQPNKELRGRGGTASSRKPGIGGSYYGDMRAAATGGRCIDSAAVSRSRGGGRGERRSGGSGRRGCGWVISARERFGDVARGSRVDSWSPRGRASAAVRVSRTGSQSGTGWTGPGLALAGASPSPGETRLPDAGRLEYKQTKGHVDVHAMVSKHHRGHS